MFSLGQFLRTLHGSAATCTRFHSSILEFYKNQVAIKDKEAAHTFLPKEQAGL